ncbi:MAG: sugar kinase [Desulfobacteraceae bacterium]|nr:sugar kinase [Desulfobacteraceae bacterium]
MFAVVGTVPDESFPLVCAPVVVSGRKLLAEKNQIPVNRGTPALLASASKVCEFFGSDMPVAWLAGDIGRGGGSRKLYAHLEETLCHSQYASLTFHYIQPDVDWHNRVLFGIEDMEKMPVLIADAGFMYAAKMSGRAGAYDVFTPDIGELAFLADPSAPHPFYTKGFIFHEPQRAEELIAAAYAHNNAPLCLLVKGEKDIVADSEKLLDTISDPVVPAMEAIGGTGDIITGLVAALTGIGYAPATACTHACRISRLAGKLAAPDPGTQVIDIIEQIPNTLKRFYKEK